MVRRWYIMADKRHFGVWHVARVTDTWGMFDLSVARNLSSSVRIAHIKLNTKAASKCLQLKPIRRDTGKLVRTNTYSCMDAWVCSVTYWRIELASSWVYVIRRQIIWKVYRELLLGTIIYVGSVHGTPASYFVSQFWHWVSFQVLMVMCMKMAVFWDIVW